MWAQCDIKQKVKLYGFRFFFVQQFSESNGQAIKLLFVTIAIEDPVYLYLSTHFLQFHVFHKHAKAKIEKL